MINWEELKHNLEFGGLYRARIPGGWLVTTVQPYTLSGVSQLTAVTFVPDPGHQWAGHWVSE
jgi:hypothetical protein